MVRQREANDGLWSDSSVPVSRPVRQLFGEMLPNSQSRNHICVAGGSTITEYVPQGNFVLKLAVGRTCRNERGRIHDLQVRAN